MPLHIWWSTRDRIVVDQRQESGRLYRAVVRANPEAPVTQYVGMKLIRLDEPLPKGVKP